MVTLPESIIDVAAGLAKQVQQRRLALNWSQKTLSERSGVSFGVIKKFERTGKLSLESLLKIAAALDALEGFSQLFPAKPAESYLTLDDLLNDKTRKRGRQ
jgi:transcriptional regulator with XRE-family HTH domain